MIFYYLWIIGTRTKYQQQQQRSKEKHSEHFLFLVQNLITIYFLFSHLPSSGSFCAIDKNSVIYRRRHLFCLMLQIFINIFVDFVGSATREKKGTTNHVMNSLCWKQKHKHIETHLISFIFITSMSVCECTRIQNSCRLYWCIVICMKM